MTSKARTVFAGRVLERRRAVALARAYCTPCHPGAIERRWTQERVVKAMPDRRCYVAGLPSSYDWSRTHARRRGVDNLFGTWAVASAAVSGEGFGAAQTSGSEALEVIGHTGDLCAQSPVIARKIRRSEEVRLPT